jgi:pimeloyl-ACP methyl ester carboxylesterase
LAGAGEPGRRVSRGYLLAYLALNLYPSRLLHRWLQRYVVTDPGRYDEDLASYQLEVQAMADGSRPCWSGRGRAIAPIAPQVLRTIRSPTLIIWGECDRVLPARGRDLFGEIPNGRCLVLDRAGHAVLFDQTARFLERVTAFLRISSSPGANDGSS